MALFGRKTEETKGEKGAAPAVQSRDFSSVLVAPRITEKAALLSDQRVYTFVVRPDATKRDVRAAVEQVFKVTPAKVRIVNRPPRAFHSRMRGTRGTLPGLKKAYVYLKEGDRIELV